MTLQQLEYVIALSKHKNFVKAAEACFITQPTLSIQLNKLEEEAGIKIFDRNKRPLKATKQGKEFIEKASEIIRLSNELKNKINNEKHDINGEFSIGIIPTMAPYILPILLQGFVKKYPHTKLKIEELQSDFIIEFLKDDKLDMGILATPLGESSIKEIPIFNEEFLLYLPEGHHLLNYDIVDPNLLDTDTLLTLSEGHCFRNQTLNICKINIDEIESNIKYEGNSIDTLMNLVDRGLGYSLIPELAIKSDLKRVRKFSPPIPSREVSIVVKNTFNKDNLIKIIRDKIIYTIPDKMLSNKGFRIVEWR